MRFKMIAGLILAGLIVIFAVLNSHTVPIKLGFYTFNPPLSILMLALIAIGMFAGMLLHSLTEKKPEIVEDTEEEQVKPKTKKKKR